MTDKPCETGTAVVCEAPAGEARSDEYSLEVNGQAVPVYTCRVSAVPFNQGWPGYQRPLDQTELAGFASWAMNGPVTIQVTPRRTFTSVVVRPVSLGIKPDIDGNRINFALNAPAQLTVELDGPGTALHLFADPPQSDEPVENSADVLTFGPGVHRPGEIELQSGQTVHIAAGAVVHTRLEGRNISNVRITGRGIIDSSQFERGGPGCIRLADCADVTIEGVILRDPSSWCLAMFGCRDISISWVKLIGLWRYNADGIDVCNSQHVSVRDCFVRAFDDALVVKGVAYTDPSYRDRPVRHVEFRRCVLWCDWGRAMEIGAETCAPEIAEVVFEDCDIIRTTHVAMDIQHGDGAALRDIRFRDIRVEIDDENPEPQFQRGPGETYTPNPAADHCPGLIDVAIRRTIYSQDEQGGAIRDILFEDIDVQGKQRPVSHLEGMDAEHDIEGVTIRSVRFNGVPAADPEAARMRVGDFVNKLRFEVV